jgi:predicted NUDIX family NTP pyrophosphohydrolase
VQGDIDAEAIQSNTFKMEWPPKSGQWKSYLEVDKAGWFDIETAKEKINPAQVVLIEELLEKFNLQNV